jgi:hypothetical protein
MIGCTINRTSNCTSFFVTERASLGQEKKIDYLWKEYLNCFRFYKEVHYSDWRAMMSETLPIFLLPAILNKTWILQVRKKLNLHSIFLL